MRVRTKHEALDAGRAQRRGHGSRLRGMVDRPVRPLGKPAPNRRVQTRRVQMDVDVNQSEKRVGQLIVRHICDEGLSSQPKPSSAA